MEAFAGSEKRCQTQSLVSPDCKGLLGPCLDSQEDNKFYSVDTLTLEADLRDSDPML